MEFQEYPKMLYFKGNADVQKAVDSAEAEEALGDDWIDAPIDPLAPVVTEKPAPAKKK